MITNYGKGNHELANLPRKINFALSPSRDDFPHVFINDVGLQAVKHPESGEVGHLTLACTAAVFPKHHHAQGIFAQNPSGTTHSAVQLLLVGCMLTM